MARIDLTLRIILADPPPGVVFSKQDAKNHPVDPVRSEGDLSFDIPITLTSTPQGLRPGGGFVRTDGRGRFVYIASGRAAGDCQTEWQRRIKIYLHDLPADLVAGDVVEATIAGRAKDGGPACATVPLLKTWARATS
ncbi:DUF5990 family protein [Caulobacter sp. FWC2]|uniref:DUF5990 family protein n=1 Tax=Caulobacter sp. FWC2 TaxID=69664 RepID=UPI000C14CAA8|nr:DUF5990 family protein [Caulobacter sp. FWC2]PIB90110.1 hypothetical protein CSW62_00090 [Caulobacter sp. FWC2]PIB94498.1 hypothetical protein CSW62_24730 [Caulobacter sp. FWC2]